jgi:hypothetical protein
VNPGDKVQYVDAFNTLTNGIVSRVTPLGRVYLRVEFRSGELSKGEVWFDKDELHRLRKAKP